MMSHPCSLGEESGDLTGQCNTLTPYRACWVIKGNEGTHHVGKHPLNDVYKSQCNSLNRQTDEQVYSQVLVATGTEGSPSPPAHVQVAL
ncbi:hypothetical protein TNCV_2953191 [Trichonephila clavipes]|nr:hypothetical protein TNCV_2953191 [Trichonephila clavipes]